MIHFLSSASRILLGAMLCGGAAIQATAGAAQASGLATPAPAPAPAPAPSGPTTGMRGVPTVDLGGGWTVKPRGRLHLDYGDLSGPPGGSARTAGPGVELRRLRFGVDGDMPGDFSYRVEGDFSGDVVEVVDAWIRYKSGPITVTVGQQNIAQSLEELTSSNDISFVERAAFTDAFGFERRMGVQAEYAAGPVLVQAGVSRENLLNINDGVTDAWGVNGRVAIMPTLGGVQLHLGAHGSWRSYGDDGRLIRYRQRAFIHSVSTRFVATPLLLAESETSWGVEAAAQAGRWHGQVESHWQRLDQISAGAANPTFFGIAAETGLFLTNDRRTLRGGIFRSVAPRRPITSGGIGALQVNVRYDRLDLTDSGVTGGTQDGYQASLIWWPVAQVRLMLNYARLDYQNAAIAISGSRNYRVNAIGTRFQINF